MRPFKRPLKNKRPVVDKSVRWRSALRGLGLSEKVTRPVTKANSQQRQFSNKGTKATR